MILKLIVLVICLLCVGAQAELLGSLPESPHKIEFDLMVLDKKSARNLEKIAVVGDKAIVERGVTVAGNSLPGNSLANDDLYVVRRSRDNRLGTTDGAILVYLTPEASLSAVASERSLTIKHEFSALNGGLLEPANLALVESEIALLVLDLSVRSAELNTNFYLVEPQ